MLVGYISRSELLDALDKAQGSLDTPCIFSAPPANSDLEGFYDIRPWLDVSPIQVTPEAPLNSVFDLFKRLGLRCTPSPCAMSCMFHSKALGILVCRLGRLIGIVTKKDLLHYIAVHERHRSVSVPR